LHDIVAIIKILLMRKIVDNVFYFHHNVGCFCKLQAEANFMNLMMVFSHGFKPWSRRCVQSWFSLGKMIATWCSYLIVTCHMFTHNFDLLAGHAPWGGWSAAIIPWDTLLTSTSICHVDLVVTVESSLIELWSSWLTWGSHRLFIYLLVSKLEVIMVML